MLVFFRHSSPDVLGNNNRVGPKYAKHPNETSEFSFGGNSRKVLFDQKKVGPFGSKITEHAFCRLLLAKQTWLGQDSGGVICVLRLFYWTDRAFPIFSPTLRTRSSNYRPEFLLAINTASASAAFFFLASKRSQIIPCPTFKKWAQRRQLRKA